MGYSRDHKQRQSDVDREADARAVIRGRRIPMRMVSNDHRKCKCRCRKTRQWQGYLKQDIVIQVLSFLRGRVKAAANVIWGRMISWCIGRHSIHYRAD